MKIGKAVGNMASDVEEYGTVSMSSPLLTLPTPTLQFDLKIPSKTYYDNARNEVAGRALAATAIQQSLGIGAQAAVDTDQLAIAKSVTAQIAPQLTANSELETIKQKRAQLAYDAKKQELSPTATEQVKTQNELDAQTEKAKILKEDSGAKDPTRPKSGTDTEPTVTGAASTQSVTTIMVDAKGEPTTDPTKKAGEKVTTQFVANANEGAPRVDPSLVAAAAIDASHTAVGAKGKAFLGSEIKLNNLDAIKAAESAKSLEGLVNFFHYPTDAMQFRDKIVMMGAVTVSVMPGWRTRKDFAGEVVMVNKYNFVTARREVVERMTHDAALPGPLRKRLAADYDLPPVDSEIPKGPDGKIIKSGGPVGSTTPGSGNTAASAGFPWIPPHLKYDKDVQRGMQPLVSGISPLMQSDTLDLASEFQRQDQFALALAVALRQQGAKGEAKVFEQFVKNQKKDVQTRSTSATVATYSRAGGVVGFQIGPRLKALDDPASRSNKSAFVLERQAFPALLVYGLDAADIYPRIHEDKERGVLIVYEAKIKNTQRSYWQQMTRRFQGPKDYFNPLKVLWPPIWWESPLRRERIYRRELDYADALFDAADQLPNETARQKYIYKWAKELQDSGDEITARYAGAYNDQYIPAEVSVPLGHVPLPDPKVAGAFPHVDTVVPPFVPLPAVPAGGEAAPFEVVFVGHGFDAVKEIRCRYAKDVVEFAPKNAPANEKNGNIGTTIRESSILMQVRVKKSVALYFELVLDPAIYGPVAVGAIPMITTPAISVVVDGKAPAPQTLVAPSPVGDVTSLEAPREIPVSPATVPALNVNLTPLDFRDPLNAIDSSLALFPDHLPAPAEPKRPRR